MTHIENRKYNRFDFSYPVDFKIFAPDFYDSWTSAFLDNISMGGSCIQFQDRYGRMPQQKIKDLRIKLKLFEPKGEDIFLLGVIRWTKSKKIDGKEFMLIGIEFESLQNWQSEKLEQFIRIKGKDHKMLWGLWDNYIHSEAG